MAVKAFPSAEGFGVVENVHGRGGAVHLVTNTNNSGAGSLRAACEASGPRIVIFKTGGTITLSSDINLNNPYIYLAGQTAPGGGILLKNYQLNIRTHNVCARHIRVHPGLGAITVPPGRQTNAILIYAGTGPKYNITLDHCHAAWATDQCGPDIYAWAYNITFQWCVTAEGMVSGGPGATTHNKGSIIGSEQWMTGATPADPNQVLTVTVHHCWFHSVADRTPLLSCFGIRQDGSGYGNPCLLADLRNNLIFNNPNNPIKMFGRFYTQSGYNNYVNAVPAPRHVIHANVVGNLMIPGAGPNLNDPGNDLMIINTLAKVWAQNNRGYKNKVSSGLPPWDGLNNDCALSGGEWDGGGLNPFTNPGAWSPSALGVVAAEPFAVPPVTTHDVDDLLPIMLAQCGATLPTPDSVLLRWRNEVETAGGNVAINHQDYPTLAAGTYPTHSQPDGIPDTWKTAHGLSTSIDYQGVTAPNGYGWVENYVNDVAGDVVPGLLLTPKARRRQVQFSMGFGF